VLSTALHLAVEQGDLENIAFMLERGADPDLLALIGILEFSGYEHLKRQISTFSYLFVNYGADLSSMVLQIWSCQIGGAIGGGRLLRSND